MEPWLWGLLLLAGVGVVVIVYGAVSDRVLNRDRQRQLTGPPTGTVPGLDPSIAPPSYITADAILATSSQPSKEPSDQPFHSMLAAGDHDQHWIGYAGREFVTHPQENCAVIDTPAVLICLDPLTDVRELYPVWPMCGSRPLVIVAPAYSAHALSTLAVNALHRPGSLLATVATPQSLAEIARITGGQPRSRLELQAGSIQSSDLGNCHRWLSNASQTWIATTPSASTDEPDPAD